MKRILITFISLVLLIVFAMATTNSAKERHFVPANVRTAGKIPYPASSVDAGFVTLSINLDETGQLTSVNILRDLPSVSALAIAAVRSWTYSAATLDGKPVASTFTINILFDPGFLGADSIPLQPPSQDYPVQKKDPAYFPAQLNTATFAPYPTNTKAQGAVVLNLTIGTTGKITKVVTLNDVPPLTASVMGVLKNWSFSAASYEGAAIESQMVVAVVFRPSAGMP
ncbi:MAG TPA: TonB family protein [Candidatus Acidoferrum sp.]|jgi:TonB family protein